MGDVLVPLRLGRPPAAPIDDGRESLSVYIETYGCQMNEADTDLVSTLLAQEGYRRASAPAAADLVLINTCAVRERAEERVFARATELNAHKRRGAVLAITGCMAEHWKERLAERAPYVDVVCGPDSYRRLADLVARARGRKRGIAPTVDVRLDPDETYAGIDPTTSADGVSGFVTVQRGCDKFCTFCIVPLTRGRERGTPLAEVLRQTRALADAGAREVTLLGQTVNSYHRDGVNFATLIRAVARTPGIERIRFTSPYPVDFTDDVIAAMAEEPRIARHVHLPLQSGSDAVLARMRRGYDAAHFNRLVATLRAAVPGVAITTDILVGFCGETEADHQLTLAAMERLGADAAFLFAYSERDGTQAARRLADDVPAELKQRRLAEAIWLQESISARVNASYVGRKERVLVASASKRSDDEVVGRTDTFKSVVMRRGNLVPGDLVSVRIDRSTSATLFGTPVAEG